MSRLAWVGCWALLTAFTSALAAEPDAKQPTVDLYGDPLPGGAKARLGTTRFRAGSGLRALAFTPDGKQVVTVSGNNTLNYWNPETGVVVKSLDLGPAKVQEFVISANGKVGVSSSFLRDEGTFEAEHSLRFWDLVAGTLASESSLEEQARNLQISADGSRLVHERSPGKMQIWDALAGVPITEQAAPRHMSAGRISPDGEQLAFGGQSTVLLHDWAANKSKTLPSLVRRLNIFFQANFSHDGKLLAVADLPRGELFLVDVGTGKKVRTLKSSRKVFTQYFEFSADGRWLLATENALTTAAYLWDLREDREPRQLEVRGLKPSRIVFAPDSSRVALGEVFSGVFGVWDVESGKRLVGESVGHEGAPRTIVVAWGGRRLVSAGYDGEVRGWDLATTKPVWQYRHEEPRSAARSTSTFVSSVAASSDGKLVASAGANGEIKVVSAETGKERYTLPGYKSKGETMLGFSSDGRRLAAFSGAARQFRVWDLASGKALAERTLRFSDMFYPEEDPDHSSLPTDELEIEALYPQGRAFSEDLGRLVTSIGPRIYLHDVESGRETRFHETPEQAVEQTALSPDGKRLAVCQLGKPIAVTLPNGQIAHAPLSYFLLRLRDTDSGDLKREIEVPGNSIGKVTFSPDGSLVAVSGRQPALILVYEVGTGKEVMRWSHDAHAVSLAFSPDGIKLYSGMSDTSVLAWNLP